MTDYKNEDIKCTKIKIHLNNTQLKIEWACTT